MHRLVIVACALAVAAPPMAAAKEPSQAERMKAVVRAWSSNLNEGQNSAEARLFSYPATIIQAPYVYRLQTPADVAKWHSLLPCSGKIISITVRGRFATAVFRLGNRATSKCDAPGTLAAARFTIVHEHITVWQQVQPPSSTPTA